MLQRSLGYTWIYLSLRMHWPILSVVRLLEVLCDFRHCWCGGLGRDLDGNEVRLLILLAWRVCSNWSLGLGLGQGHFLHHDRLIGLFDDSLISSLEYQEIDWGSDNAKIVPVIWFTSSKSSVEQCRVSRASQLVGVRAILCIILCQVRKAVRNGGVMRPPVPRSSHFFNHVLTCFATYLTRNSPNNYKIPVLVRSAIDKPSKWLKPSSLVKAMIAVRRLLRRVTAA